MELLVLQRSLAVHLLNKTVLPHCFSLTVQGFTGISCQSVSPPRLQKAHLGLWHFDGPLKTVTVRTVISVRPPSRMWHASFLKRRTSEQNPHFLLPADSLIHTQRPFMARASNLLRASPASQVHARLAQKVALLPPSCSSAHWTLLPAPKSPPGCALWRGKKSRVDGCQHPLTTTTNPDRQNLAFIQAIMWFTTRNRTVTGYKVSRHPILKRGTKSWESW